MCMLIKWIIDYKQNGNSDLVLGMCCECLGILLVIRGGSMKCAMSKKINSSEINRPRGCHLDQLTVTQLVFGCFCLLFFKSFLLEFILECWFFGFIQIILLSFTSASVLNQLIFQYLIKKHYQ